MATPKQGEIWANKATETDVVTVEAVTPDAVVLSDGQTLAPEAFEEQFYLLQVADAVDSPLWESVKGEESKPLDL